MPAPTRIMTSPLHLTGRLSAGQVALVVAADAVARRARAEGADPAVVAPSLTGDLAVQLAVERELYREGSSRTTVGREAFVDRVRTFEADARRAATALLADVGAPVDLDAAAGDAEAVVRAANTAFVRLYEAGLLERVERVVDLCPRCGTVVDPADAEPAELASCRLTVRVPRSGGGTLDVGVVAAELLPGAVAIAVPDGHEAAGDTAVVPLVAREVPVVADPDVAEPTLLVPAHDAHADEVARRLGLGAIRALDGDGVACVAPLDGLARYAARQAAADLLEAEGALAGREEVAEATARCRRCANPLLPLLGRHWFLAVADLEAAAGDAVRDGTIVFTPPAARDEFLDRAGRTRAWCLSHQLEAGHPVPVATCLDCGRAAITVDEPHSCGTCMGSLEPDDGVLDARFVAATWALAAAGWPADEGGPARLAPTSALLVGPNGLARWALPMAALGLRLAGAVPFEAVSVHLVDRGEADVADVLDAGGPRTARAALLRGDVDDVDGARAAVESLDDPPEGEADVDAAAEACAAAFAVAAPAAALAVLSATAATGVRPGVVDRVRALAAPLVGD